MKALYIQYIQLFVRTPSDSVVTFNDIDIQTQTQQLKSKLELRTGIIAEAQTLYLNGLRLDNTKTLEESGIRKNSFLRLKLKESSLEQIYINAIVGNTKEVFRLGVELIQQSELDQFDAWNMFVPVRAFQAIFAACFANQLDTVTQLLSKGATNIDMVTKNGRSVLHVASFQGHLMCVNFLLVQGVDVKLTDMSGNTALSLAAENGHAKVEKRIWLYLWNMDVLDELKLEKQKENKNEDVEELKEEARRCRDMYESTKLPILQITSKSVAKEKATKAKSKEMTPLPELRIDTRNEVRKTITNKKLVTEDMKLEKMTMLQDDSFTNKLQSEVRDKKQRVCAWVQGNTHKEPSRNILQLPSPTQLIQEKKPVPRNPNVPVQELMDRKVNIEDSEESKCKDETYHEGSIKQKSDEEDTMKQDDKPKASTCSTIFLSSSFDYCAVEPDRLCMNKEVIKTNATNVNKARPAGYIEEEEKRNEVSEKPQEENIDQGNCHSCQQMSLSVMDADEENNGSEMWDVMTDSITINSFGLNEQEENVNNIRDNSDFWRPESSLLSMTSDFCRRYAKTYEEWLKEKKKAKKEGRRRKDSTVSNESDLIDKTEKNEEAFNRWVAQKLKEQRVSRAESHSKKIVGRRREERFGIAFEEWLKSKIGTSSLKLNKDFEEKNKHNKHVAKGISFDEWKTRKIEEGKASKTSTENLQIEQNTKSKRGISFETWLREKADQEKYRLQLEAILKAQEKRRESFMIRFRSDDPRQLTFEEWYWEKEERLALERKERKKLAAERKQKHKRYPEDSNLIFDMWLADKFKTDIEYEKKMLKNDKKNGKTKKMLSTIKEIDGYSLSESPT